MRTKDQVSEDKLRGGFYSPDVLVDLCLTRASTLIDLPTSSGLRVLEPSAGDGSFLRGVARSPLHRHVSQIEAIEIMGPEASKVEGELTRLDLPGRAINASVFDWAENSNSEFDLVLANPPYVRFQFVSDADKQRARYIAAEVGAKESSVSNLWIPVLLLSLGRVRHGGVFSVILPTEFLTGVSASAVRDWLISNACDLTIDLFKPGSFPNVLQEVLILTGRKTALHGNRSTFIQFHDHNGGTRSWTHEVERGLGTWTSFLLLPSSRQALLDVQGLSSIVKVGSQVRFSVSTVTGANGYFCITADEVAKFDLFDWAIPMLPRTRYAKGLIYAPEDAQVLDTSGHRAWMVSFAADKPSPEGHTGAQRYLDAGEVQEIDRRYKCRVRTPWYRVPVVPAGELLLSKRSNRFPRVISNHARSVTTDTIYRGQVLPSSDASADDFAATFHNSLTLLSAEIEGRSFGGGVLELVPSEVSSLQIPAIPNSREDLAALDKVARWSIEPEELIQATDEMVVRRLPALDAGTLAALGKARVTLMERRLQRTSSEFFA